MAKDWKKDEVKIIAPSTNMPEGLALKVVAVSTTGGKSKVTYQTPSIDELFKSATIDIDQGLSTNMILSAKMRNGVALNFGITKEQNGRLGRGVWFPDGGTTHDENATPIHDNAIDTINMSFESMVYEDKEENELLKISGKTTLKNMRVKYSFSQSITPPKLKSNFGLSYEASSELRADLVVHKTGNAANVAPETFQCGGIDIDKEGLGYKVKISGADFDKKDICIGSLSVELSEVPIKASVGGGAITDAPVGLRLFFIMGADMEIKVSSTVILRKSDYREVGVKVDTTKSGKEQFQLWDHDYVSKTNHAKATWEKKIYGEISGRMTQYQGLAAAPFVLGIYPAVVRAYAGPELTGTAKAGYGTRTGLNACFDVGLAAKYGMTASVYLGIDLDNQYWDKLDWHHVFEYYNDIKGSDQLYAYNSCQADGYTVSFGTPPQSAGDFSATNIKVKDSTGRIIAPEKITYNLYRDGHIIRSGDSVDALVADLEPGNYEIEAIVLIDSDRTIKSSIRHAYTVGSNQPPTANAGADQQVDSNATVTLDGSGSSDSDGQIVSYVWLEGGTQVGTGVSLVLDNVSGGVHTYTLTVTDDEGNVDSDSVVVIVGTATSVLKKTGQTKSYDEDGNEVTDGSIKDDGYYRKGVTPSYSRDDTKEIVIDNLTGLQWQDDASAASVEKPWLTSANYNTCKNNTNSPSCYDTSGDTAATYCSNLTLGGHNDWRLPTMDELMNIADRSKSDPAIDTAYFQNVSNGYWSSSTFAHFKGGAWYLQSWGGSAHAYTKDAGNYVRCVRGGQ